MQIKEIELSQSCGWTISDYAALADRHEPTLFLIRLPTAGITVLYCLGPTGLQPLMWPQPPVFLREIAEWGRAFFNEETIRRIKSDFARMNARPERFPFLGQEMSTSTSQFAQRFRTEVDFHVSYANSLAVPADEDIVGILTRHLDGWFASMAEFAFRPIAPVGWDWLEAWRRSPHYRLFNQHHLGTRKELQPAVANDLLDQLRSMLDGNGVDQLREIVREQVPVALHYSQYWERTLPFMRPQAGALSQSLAGAWENVYAFRARLIRALGWPLFYMGARIELTAVELLSVQEVANERPRPVPTQFDAQYETEQYCVDMESRFPILVSHPLIEKLTPSLRFADACAASH